MIQIDDPRDPRLADYLALTDAELRRRFESRSGVFMVEGFLAIDALLRSRFSVRSILTTPNAHARLAPSLGDVDAPVYVVSDAVMRGTVGFDLHRGAVASAIRPSPLHGNSDSDLDIDELLRTSARVLVLEGVNDHENIGAIFRNAAAFGVDAVLLDPTTADPLYRRCVRVSLGHVLHVPFARLTDWPASLHRLTGAGLTTVAMTPGGESVIDEVGELATGRLALLLGAEGPGLSAQALAAATRRVRIPLATGVDSLNVATAAALALFALRRPGSNVT